MLIISHLELSLLELSILWANWWHWPHFTDKQIELRAVHSFAQGFVDVSSRAHSATSLCKKHSETQRECSLWVGRPGSHLRCPRAGVLASPSGSEALAGLPDSDIRGSPKSVLVLKRYDLRTRCLLLAVICFSIFAAPFCQNLVCSATRSGKISKYATESALSPSIRRGGEKCTSYFKLSFSPCSQASLTKRAQGLPGSQAASRSWIWI